MVDDAVGIVGLELKALGSFSGQGKAGDPIVATEAQYIEESSKKFEASSGVGLVEFLGDVTDIDSGADEVGDDLEGLCGSTRVTKGTGVGADGDKQVGGDGFGDGEIGLPE